YLIGLTFGDEYIRTTGRLMVETLVLSGFITISTRVIIGRSRPYNRIGNGTFTPFTFNFLYHSFPSGHITISFALATILSNRIDEWWATAGLYTLAALNTTSRLYFSEHWASDTFMSASIGILSALAVIKAYENSIEKKETEEKKYDIGISPLGVQFQYRF
ncbi:MAG: phosphatase PAP2 family protein, partial [Candidatus Kapaibacterium sp.]